MIFQFFQGPFAVSHKFVCVLLCQGVLQPKIVDSFFKYGLKGSNNTETSSFVSSLDDDEEDSASFNASGKHYDQLDLSKESPAESLARLFLFTGKIYD